MICKFFMSGNCRFGDKCRFTHPPTSSSSASTASSASFNKLHFDKPCRYFLNNNCIRPNCKFKHIPQTALPAAQPGCAICYDQPSSYAILPPCDHAFCAGCISSWKANKDNNLTASGVTNRCPICRAEFSYYATSSFFFVSSSYKSSFLLSYKRSLASIPCKYFAASYARSSNPTCPFGNDCLYQHNDRFGNRMTAHRPGTVNCPPGFFRDRYGVIRRIQQLEEPTIIRLNPLLANQDVERHYFEEYSDDEYYSDDEDDDDNHENVAYISSVFLESDFLSHNLRNSEHEYPEEFYDEFYDDDGELLSD